MGICTEKETFEVVYEENFSYIYNYVYGQLLHREKSEDLVSDIFMKAMTHYEQFDPSRASVKTWLTNIARNTVIDEFRRSGKRSNVSLDDEDNPIDPSYEDEYEVLKEDTQKDVYRLLSHLSEPERELLVMVYFENMKNDQIGSVLGINSKAVSERHRRLLVKCRKIAGEIGIDGFI